MKNKIFEPLGYLSVIIGIIGVFTFACVSCNQQIIDTTYTFDRAIIQISNDEVIEIEVASWKDYDDSDQIQVKSKDGTTYLVHSSRITLISDKK
jgi:hypothetical protein